MWHAGLCVLCSWFTSIIFLKLIMIHSCSNFLNRFPLSIYGSLFHQHRPILKKLFCSSKFYWLKSPQHGKFNCQNAVEWGGGVKWIFLCNINAPAQWGGEFIKAGHVGEKYVKIHILQTKSSSHRLMMWWYELFSNWIMSSTSWSVWFPGLCCKFTICYQNTPSTNYHTLLSLFVRHADA